MRTPTLTTEDLILRPLYHAILANVEWLNTPLNVRFSEQRHHLHTLAKSQAYIRTFDQENDRIWIIRLHTDNTPIGTITSHLDRHNARANMGILIDHNFWGQGYGFQAWNVVMNFLFEDGVRKIEAGTMAVNSGMVATFRKAGMQHEGQRPGHFLLQTKPVGLVLFGKTNDR